MPLNEHLVAFNDARNEANLMDAHEFVFRGKTYHRGTWKNGVPVWYRQDRKKSGRKSGRKKSGGNRKKRRADA